MSEYILLVQYTLSAKLLLFNYFIVLLQMESNHGNNRWPMSHHIDTYSHPVCVIFIMCLQVTVYKYSVNAIQLTLYADGPLVSLEKHVIKYTAWQCVQNSPIIHLIQALCMWTRHFLCKVNV